MAKQDKKQKAKELAQAFGKRVTRSEVQAAEADGYSLKQIERAASRANKTGKSAQGYIDAGGSDGYNTGADAKLRSAALPGTAGQSVALDNTGRYLAAGPKGLDYLRDNKDAYIKATLSGDVRAVKQNSAKKINNYVQDNGYYLTPGKGRVVVGQKKVTLDAQSSAGDYDYMPQGKAWVPIYADSNPSRGGGNGRGNGNGNGNGRDSGGGGGGREGRDIRRATREAQRTLYGGNRIGNRPPIFGSRQGGGSQGPTTADIANTAGTSGPSYGRGYTVGQGINDVANFSDTLDRYNQRQIGALFDVAEGSRYESGRILNQWVNTLPKAPKLDDVDDFIKAAQATISGINFDT